MENKFIIVSGAEENNLKKIDVTIPHNKITTICGVSGSGKSSLIYSVLAKEAIRREKIDSGNATCLDYAIRPKFEAIKNLPYCITLKQRGLSQAISSTLATVSGLHELLRDEFTKYGEIVACNGNKISAPNTFEIRKFINKYYSHDEFNCFAVICFNKYTDGSDEFKFLNEQNIKKIVLISSYDNVRREKKLSELKQLNSKYHYTILVKIPSINYIDSFEKIALKSFIVENKTKSFNFYFDYFDLSTGILYQKKSSELLSFNSTLPTSGKCLECDGHGVIDTIDHKNLFCKNRVLKDTFLNLEINDKGCYKYILLCQDTIQKYLKKFSIDANKNYFELNDKHQKIINNLVFPRILKHRGRPTIGKYVRRIQCPTCHGSRLNYKANAVKLHGVNITEILNYSVSDAYDFLFDKSIHHNKILSILSALKNATLGYLSLARSTDTLSGGELQRLKLAIELTNSYQNLLYILDEPSSGLHPYNNYQMIKLIHNLKEKNNTVIISEHNPIYIENCDHTIELGPHSGIHGGEVIFEGKTMKKPKNSMICRNILTKEFEYNLKLDGVTVNNIKDENFIFPLYSLVCISGVSGSGKSSLIHKALVPSIKQYIADKSYPKNLIKRAVGLEKIKSVIELTQAQIGLNSRSIVATYLNIFDEIRDLYSSLDVSKEFNFDKGFFSFNSESGYCVSCKGLGVIDNFICPTCLGNRYKPEVLNIFYKNKNIINVLNSSISELMNIFNNDKLLLSFSVLNKLGLSHLTLGRITSTLSGGEAQRLRLAKVLIESMDLVANGGLLFVLDEPSSGLNTENINQILTILDEIISYKNSVIIIEHNLDIISCCDYIIDIGVESGENGGKNVFSGAFNELLNSKESLTAKAFRGEYEKPSIVLKDNQNLETKKYRNNSILDCNKFYLDDEHFRIEKLFANEFNVKTDNKSFHFFKSKEELINFIETLNKPIFSFNPFVSDLYKYKIVPTSIRKKKIKHLIGLGFDAKLYDEKNDWDFRIPASDLDQAYNYGHGWVTVITEDNIRYELSTRLISAENMIIGSPVIDESTFNLYLNSCLYCSGRGNLPAYDKTTIIENEKLSISDDGFFKFKLNLKLKSVINKLKQEGLFDFSKPFYKLTEYEKNIFLFGFNEYRFIKPNGRLNAISDYIKWQGLYAYVYQEMNKISIDQANKITHSKHNVKCPFCTKGINAEVGYYYVEDSTILDYL